jgi:phosphoribosylanthranilate isomerase
VFRDESAQRVVDVVNGAGLRAAQLHGHETVEQTQSVRSRVPMVIKVFAAGDPRLDRADKYGADVVMIDSPTPGSGDMFDWSLAEDAPHGVKLLLAGGLTPENVAEAIAKVRPWGVDVASGVESIAGRKDARKVREFIRNAKQAAPRPYTSAEDARPFDWEIEPYL